MTDRTSQSATSDMGYYYAIRVLISHPSIDADAITAALEMEPTYCWPLSQKRDRVMWAHVSWTYGERLFFEEMHSILEWLQGRGQFVSSLLASGGEIQVIAELPGVINIGDTLHMRTLELALKLGVLLAVEVFPKLSAPHDVKGAEAAAAANGG